jgi:hypothetical protein
VAAKSSSPVLGALCQASHKKPSDTEGKEDADSAGPKVSDDQRITADEVNKPQGWTVSVGYRFQPSSRHFVGSVEQKQREIAHNQVQNVLHLFDLSVERQISRRWALDFSVPFSHEYRDQSKTLYRTTGIGDMTVGARYWIFRPPTENGGNIVVGMSLKLPTGKDNSTGSPVSKTTGQPVQTALADQSIQLGDGGVGFSIDMQAYRPLVLGSMGYVTGSYLFNPEETNGVLTGRSKQGEGVMSVADQYLARAGVAHAVPGLPIVITMGLRMEGVPVKDVFGGSLGFRRPGYAVSGDPGFLVSVRNNVFSCNVPWAIYRKRPRSVADLTVGGAGDAAFADYLVTIGYSRRF